MADHEDKELEELKRQVPPGWYASNDGSQQQYWDGDKWTNAFRPTESGEPGPRAPTVNDGSTQSSAPSWPRPPVWLIVIVTLVAGWLFFFHTNPGKRLTATLGLRECYEITLTGEVVCGEGAERIEDLQQGAREQSQQLEQSSDNLTMEVDADAALAKRSIITDRTTYTESGGYELVIGTQGLFGTDPEKVCNVMREEGLLPATVESKSDGAVLDC